MAWGLLIIAGLLEVVWAVSLKHADGFTRLWPSAIAVASAAASLFLLSLALRNLPVGSAYAAWVGIGTAGVATAGIIAYEEALSLPRIASLILIVAGIVGLTLFDG